MSAIEQRARELLAAIPASPTPEDESERVMVWEKDALAAIIAALTIAESFASQAGCAIRISEIAQRRADRAALTPPEGFVLVPVEPTEEMLEAGRAAVMAEHSAGIKWTPRQHFEASGRSTAGIPEDVLDERGPLTKESTAVMVFGSMLAARPEVP